MLVIFLILARIVLAQSSPPALGIQIGDPELGLDIRFPLTVTQCEPVFINYNNTSASNTSNIISPTNVAFYAKSGGFFAMSPIPAGAGYYEWICNIPAGYSFLVWCGFGFHHLIVQPGPLWSCLHNVSTTYQYASYDMAFASYTAHPQNMATISVGPGLSAT